MREGRASTLLLPDHRRCEPRQAAVHERPLAWRADATRLRVDAACVGGVEAAECLPPVLIEVMSAARRTLTEAAVHFPHGSFGEYVAWACNICRID